MGSMIGRPWARNFTTSTTRARWSALWTMTPVSATLNTLSIIGNWSFDSGLAISASADYRRSPFPLTENALIGQTAGSIDELLNTLTEDQIRQLAVDRTGQMLTYSLGVSQPLAERWQVNADFTVTQLAEGPDSGGVLALPDSGDRVLRIHESRRIQPVYRGRRVDLRPSLHRHRR